MTLRVYVGGGISGRSIKVVREKHEHAARVLRERGLVPVSPLQGEVEDLKGQRVIKDDESGVGSDSGIILKDLYLLKHCDVHVILTGSTLSYGTASEWGYSHWKLGIPVVVCDPEHKARKASWARYTAAAIVDTVEEAADWIAKYLVIPDEPVLEVQRV